mmetsp:Transcript_64690/g.127852  ORF Transcript_64690/g.127852 Transcript_64690/m.127852 type:complete len:213 (+) Transcript_64690:417-1055(+)
MSSQWSACFRCYKSISTRWRLREARLSRSPRGGTERAFRTPTRRSTPMWNNRCCCGGRFSHISPRCGRSRRTTCWMAMATGCAIRVRACTASSLHRMWVGSCIRCLGRCRHRCAAVGSGRRQFIWGTMTCPTHLFGSTSTRRYQGSCSQYWASLIHSRRSSRQRRASRITSRLCTDLLRRLAMLSSPTSSAMRLTARVQTTITMRDRASMGG